ncbi:tetratricopeptide repeat protein [Candidatus Dependentiae bacterium]|nr:tetratricopeptide repeat protein [Candidatus Dependentiae bacterium]
MNKKYYIFWIVFLSIIIFLSYYPAIYNDFVGWDDQNYVRDNPYIRELSFNSIKNIFTSFHLDLYKPVVIFSFAIDYYFVKLKPWLYHLNNIILHIFNSNLVFCLIFLLSYFQKNYREKYISFFKFKFYVPFFNGVIVSLLFALHPMHTESVVWVAERKDQLYGFFLLLSLIFYLLYVLKKNWKYYIASLIFIVLSNMSKPMSISFFLMVFAADFVIRRPISKKSLFDKIPYILICMFFFYLIILGGKLGHPDKELYMKIQFGIGSPKLVDAELKNPPPLTYYMIKENIKYPMYVILFYFTKLLIPVKLSALYPYPPYFEIVYSHIITPIIFLLIFYSLKYTRHLFFGWFFFIFSFLTVIQIKMTGPALVADRYTYLASIGIFWGITVFLIYLFNKNKTGLFYCMTVFIFIFSFYSAYKINSYRCGVWKTSINLWNDVIENYPNATTALNNRGCILLSNGYLDLAEQDFLAGLKANKYDPGLMENLGRTYFLMKKNDKSIEIYENLIKLYPVLYEHYFTLAYLYFEKQRYDKISETYQKLYKLTDKYDFIISNNMGIINRRIGKYPNAEKYFKKSIELKPDYHFAYNNLGVLYYYQKNYKEAEKYFRKAAEIEQYYPEALNNLGEIYFEYYKNYNEAKKYYEKAINLKENYKDAIANLEKVEKLLNQKTGA